MIGKLPLSGIRTASSAYIMVLHTPKTPYSDTFLPRIQVHSDQHPAVREAASSNPDNDITLMYLSLYRQRPE